MINALDNKGEHFSFIKDQIDTIPKYYEANWHIAYVNIVCNITYHILPCTCLFPKTGKLTYSIKVKAK